MFTFRNRLVREAGGPLSTSTVATPLEAALGIALMRPRLITLLWHPHQDFFYEYNVERIKLVMILK